MIKPLINIKKQLEEENLIKVKISDIRFKGFFVDRLIDRGSIRWDKKQIDLKDKIKKEGLNQKKYGYIIINHKNFCLNGHHRLVILKELYGEDYQLDVNKVNLGWYKLMFFAFILKLGYGK